MPLLPLILAFLLCSIRYALAGEGTYPLAYIIGPQIIENSTHIPTGFYTFQHVETGKYLQFIDYENQIVPTEGANSTVFNGTLWTVKWHGDKNYSVHHLNRVRYDKCMSTRWDHFKGIDDAAVAWQCEVDNKTRDAPDFDIYPKFKGVYNASRPRPLEKRDSHLERRYENIYEAIRPDKQQWLFMRADPSKEYEWKNVHFDPSKGDNVYTGDVAEPNRKKHINAGTHQFYIVSAAHLWNMIPRCLYAQASYEFAFTANNTGVTVLDHCGWANYSQLWNVTLWKPASFVLGEEANPSFAVDPTDFWLWDARTAPIWWASFAFFTLVLWMCH